MEDCDVGGAQAAALSSAGLQAPDKMSNVSSFFIFYLFIDLFAAFVFSLSVPLIFCNNRVRDTNYILISNLSFTPSP